MADEVQDNFGKIYTLAVVAGIKRDGTQFESSEFTDGVWCRFQRGRPKKMGGYRALFRTQAGIGRGMISSPQNGVNYIFIGYSSGIQIFTSGTTLGAGAGPYDAIVLVGYSPVPLVSNTTNQFVVVGDKTAIYPVGTKVCFTQDIAPPTYTVTAVSFDSGSTQTTVTFSPSLSTPTTYAQVYIANNAFLPNPNYTWQFDIQYSPTGGKLNVIASPGANLQNIDSGRPTQLLIGPITPNANSQWEFQGLSDSAGQNPTYKPIEVDGGVVCLYPFIFAYGSNGLIINNNVDISNYATQSQFDWNGPFANAVNMSASKIIRGLPMRGGTNAPSGLFWATDSLIRVSFTGQAPLYWRYDIVGGQISIISSNAVVEMGGVHYWMGVDRFYQYNGNVSVLPNDKNVNWLFDNLNFLQRQKVWATKVPRYNEIWFFYPRGTATECTDAIIYNVKDSIWYDAGQAIGAQRSTGYTTEIFPSPVWCDWNYEADFSLPATVIATPSGQPAPTANQFYVAGDATQLFSPGDYLSTTNVVENNFVATNKVTTSIYTYVEDTAQGYTLVTCVSNFNPNLQVGQFVYFVDGGYTVWEHEFGVNRTSQTSETAIYSSITTSDISWIGGDPTVDKLVSVNRRMHIRRFEPDFLQTGPMDMLVIGRKFPSSEETETSGPYTFVPGQGKIDMRVEHRLIQLQFISNTINGNFELGRNLVTAEFGDERP